MGNSQYNAYISKYDETALQNPSSIPIAELKNHITIRPIGNKTHDEIFGLYNPNPCFATIITGIETSYVGGTTCSDPGMHHTNPADCDCGTSVAPNCTPPIQGYPVYSYIYGQIDLCGSGGGNIGTTTTPIGGTVPNGGGGGSSNTTSNTYNECTKLKNDLIKAKEIYNKTNIKTQNNTMTASIAADENEKGFAFGKDSIGVYQVAPIITLGPNGGSIPLTNLGFTPEGDFHNHNGITAPPAPSPPDIYSLHDTHAAIPTFSIRFVNGSDGSTYAITITNQAYFDAFVQQNPMNLTVDVKSPSNPNGDNLWMKDTNIGKDYLRIAQYFVNKNYSASDAYLYGMAFIAKQHKMGIVISKKNSDGDFKPIGIKLKPNTYDIEKPNYETTTPCNL